MRTWLAVVAASAISSLMFGAASSAQSLCVEGEDAEPENCTLAEADADIPFGGDEEIVLRYPDAIGTLDLGAESDFIVLQDASGRTLRLPKEFPKLQPLSIRGANGQYEPAMREGRRLYRLTEDYAYLYETTCELVVVPENYVTDLVSVPRLARLFYSPANYPEGAVVHDWLYAIGEDGMKGKSDTVFQQILKDFGHSRTVWEGLYLAVSRAASYPHKEDFLFWNPDAEQLYPGSPPRATGFSWLGGTPGSCGLPMRSGLSLR